jgi:hypothetical protein
LLGIVTVAVVDLALLRIRENLERLRDFFEAIFGIRVSRIDVWVTLPRQLAIGLLYVIGLCAARHT